MSIEPTPWVDGLTIGQVLRETARRHADRDAMVFRHLDQVVARSPDRATPTTAGLPDEEETCGPELRRGRETRAEHRSETRAEHGSGCYRRTWRELDAEVDRVAQSLMALGIQQGEHVASWATNWPQWVLLQLAAARIGAVFVTVNPAYRASELSYVLKQSDAAALFLVDRFRKSDYFAILDQAIGSAREGEAPAEPQSPAGVHSATAARREPRPPGPYGGRNQISGFPKLRSIVSMKAETAPGMLSWPAFLELAENVGPDELAARERQLKASDAINIQYTSGTTGFPKGATLTHRNILMNAFYIGDCQRITEQDRICVPVPFYHCFGCVLGILCCTIYGSALVAPAEYFDPAATLDALEAERCTSIYGVPTMFIAQLNHPSFAGRDLTSLRTGIMAGSPCPIEVMQRVVNEMHAREITIAYGLTEAAPVITQTRVDDPLELRVKTVGRKIPDVEVKLVDPVTGETIAGDWLERTEGTDTGATAPSAQGELCTRGHGVMLGYYGMPEATAAAIDADGWLHSGDLAVRLPNGYYRITGRIKDMICRGGENIYPREIEEFLYTHPAIQDVAVFGVPDARMVEEVAAWIRLRDGASLTEAELKQFCCDRLAHYKVPRYVRFVAEFPQTVTGKIQKFRMREMMQDELGLKDAETA